MTEVPVRYCDGTDLYAAAFPGADNRTNEWAPWNDAELAKLHSPLAGRRRGSSPPSLPDADPYG